jgi:hypothetical protein
MLPEPFVGVEQKEKKFLEVAKSQGLVDIRKIIIEEVEKEKSIHHNGV